MKSDINPVHFDERFAKIKNIERPICHGLLIASLLTEIGGQIGWLASGMSLKFISTLHLDSCSKKQEFDERTWVAGFPR